MDFIMIRTFCSLGDTVKRMKTQATTERKYLQITCLTKDLHPVYIKNSQNAVTEKQTTNP